MFKIVRRLTAVGEVERVETPVVVAGASLRHYLGEGDWIVAVNGKMVEVSPDELFPANGDWYDVMAVPTGSFDRRENWKALFQIAAMTASFVPGWNAAAILIGSSVVSALWPSAPPKEFTQSQTYSWQHKGNAAADASTPMPIVYGKTRVKPIIKNRFIVSENDKQYLYVLYGCTGHLIDERTLSGWQLGRYYDYGDEVTSSLVSEPGRTFVCKRAHTSTNAITYYDTDYWDVGPGTAKMTDIRVNNNGIENYHDISYETRPGLALQTVIADFDATYNSTTPNVELYIDYPSPAFNMATIYKVFPFVYWKKHTIRYKGITYEIKAGSTLSTNNYFYWGVGDTTYTCTNSGATPAGVFFIGNFDNAKNKFIKAYFIGITIPSATDWYTVNIDVDTTQNIQVDLAFPSGLYELDSAGKIIDSQALIFAQYRKTGASTWTDFPYMANANAFTEGEHEVAPGYWAGILKRRTTEPIFISFKAKATGTAIVNGRVPPNSDVYLDQGTYEVRIAAYSYMEVQLTCVSSITYGDFSYPGEALLGIKALASGQLSGDLDVSVVVERSTVKVNNGTTWVDKPANLHAWAIYDIFANGCAYHPQTSIGVDGALALPVYGCGVLPARLDYASFLAWATYTHDTLEHELNIVFDTFMTAWDAILRICQEGRGMVYPIGAKIFALVDKPSTAVQLFTDGNINIDSFSEEWIPKAGKTNCIETTYFEADRDYEKVTLNIKRSVFDTGDDMADPMGLTLYGTTSRTQAFNTANFMLKCNELHTHTVRFSVAVDALEAEVGDVIKVQHSVPEWGYGGRIVSVVAGVITVDKEITVWANQSYTFEVLHASGLIESHTFVAGVSYTGLEIPIEVNLPTPFTETPAAYEVYAFGSVTNIYKQYRITAIDRSSELVRIVSALNYDETVYDLDPEPILGITAKIAFPTATNLHLQEVISRRSTGEYESSIVATWAAPNNYNAEWDVFFRDVDSTDLGWRGEWSSLETYNYLDKVEHNGVTYLCIGEGITSEPVEV